ncbi:hypothetical protein ABZ772_24890 [Streptomyces griseoincarnatus]
MTQITAIPSKTATAPAAFEPLGGIISGDGLHTNEDIARTRRYLTVEQAEHMAAVADQRAEDAAREHPEPAGLLAEDRARDANLAFSRALDAIEAALQVSQDLDLTRRGLLAAVDAYTDEARRP